MYEDISRIGIIYRFITLTSNRMILRLYTKHNFVNTPEVVLSSMEVFPFPSVFRCFHP